MITQVSVNRIHGKAYSNTVVLVQNFFFCTGIALLLWKFVPILGQQGFWPAFVHSQFIGNSICLMLLLSPKFPDYFGIQGKLLGVVQLVVIPLLGTLFGLVMASLVLGRPISETIGSMYDWPLVTSALVAVVASFLFNAYLSHRQKMLKLELSASEERRRADNARHAMLQAQLEPHMLFNTLANLRALISSDPDRALQMLDRLDSFLRETLSSSQKPTHTLAHEFGVLDDYLSLLKVRFGDRLSYSLHLKDECKNINIPSLLLQPLVENAIKHGIEPKLNGGEVVVSAELDGVNTKLSVTDTGVGMHSIQETIYDESISSGFGLSSLRKRLTQSYGNRASVEISPYNTIASSGTAVTVLLPVKMNENKR